MNPDEGCKYNRTKKRLINVSKSLLLKVGRGSGFVNVDDLQVVVILLWSEIFLIGGNPRLSL